MKTDLTDYPVLAELCDIGDLTIRGDVKFPPCPRCKGTGKEPAEQAPGYGGLRPARETADCHECGGAGEDPRKGVSIYALGIQPEMAAGIRGCTFTPWFESLAELNEHCTARRADILKEIGE